MIEKFLESTNLSEKANWKDIRDFVKEANELNVLGVCTYIYWSGIVDKYLKEGIKKIYVIGFYTGSKELIERDLSLVSDTKADEYDVVLPLAYFSVGNISKTEELLLKVRKATKDKVLKVIIETNILREDPKPEEKIKSAVELVKEIGADFIKTNTGRFPRKIDIVEDIRLIKKFTKLPIKAAGGIKTYEQVKQLIDLGVSRIGTSTAKQIIEEENGIQ